MSPNQSIIYALAPSARSRVTTAYMTSAFVSAAVCSALASTIYNAAGWRAVAALGAGLSLAGVIVWVLQHTLRGRSKRQQSVTQGGTV